jgi:hypothetical protein
MAKRMVSIEMTQLALFPTDEYLAPGARLDDGFPCGGCGIATWPGEWYMVHGDVWARAGMGQHGMLCVGCLEERLGRPLAANDFNDAPINRLTLDTSDSARLRAAKKRSPTRSRAS